MELYTPIQLIPADLGWLAVYRDEKTSELFMEPVLCWALCEVWEAAGREVPIDWRKMTGPHRHAVVGMVMSETGPEPAESCCNLAGYMRAGGSPEAQPWF